MRLFLLGGTSEARPRSPRALSGRRRGGQRCRSPAARNDLRRSPIADAGRRVRRDGRPCASTCAREKIDRSSMRPIRSPRRCRDTRRRPARREDAPLRGIIRPPWRPGTATAGRRSATPRRARAPRAPQRVFLTIGRLGAPPWQARRRIISSSVRSTRRRPGEPSVSSIWFSHAGRSRSTTKSRLMRDEKIDVLVSKNTGGGRREAKLDAARAWPPRDPGPRAPPFSSRESLFMISKTCWPGSRLNAPLRSCAASHEAMRPRPRDRGGLSRRRPGPACSCRRRPDRPPRAW